MTEQKYGPQTAEIEALVERVKAMTPEQAEALSKAYHSISLRESWSAKEAAQEAEDSADRYPVRQVAWYSAWGAARHAPWTGNAAWLSAWYAVRDAIWALVLRDLITTEQFDTLYETWASVMDKQLIS
jgi:surface antigen